MAYRDVVLADSPIYYWELEEQDFSINSGSVTTSGGAATSGLQRQVAGKYGLSIATTTKSQRAYLTLADTTPFTDKVFSIEAWVNPASSSGNDYLFSVGASTTNGTNGVLYVYKSTSGTGNVATAFIKGSGTGRGVVGTTNLADGNWHHIVVTVNGDTMTLYVDGASEGTPNTAAIGTFTPPSARFTWADAAAAAGAIGGYDETAIYDYALTPQQVADHYNNVSPAIDDGYNAEVMAGSALMTDAGVSATSPDRTISVAPMTASATMPGGAVAGRLAEVTATEDTYVSQSSPDTNQNTRGYLAIGSGLASFVKAPVTVEVDEAIVKATARFYQFYPSAPTKTVNVYRVDADWNEASLTFNNKPAWTLLRTVQVTAPTGTWFEVDVTGAHPTYGFALQSSTTGGNPIQPLDSENADASLRPYVNYQILPIASVSVVAEPATALAAMPIASVSAGSNLNLGAAPMTANAAFPEPSVEMLAGVLAEPMDAQASMPQGHNYAGPVDTFAEPMTASAEAVDVDVDVQVGATIAAAPAKATAVWKQAASVNGSPIVANELDDKFAQRVLASNPRNWLRLNDTGTSVFDRARNAVSGTYVGVTSGLFDGPDGRHSVNFDGSGYIKQTSEGTGNEAGPADSTLEFSIRTTKANQFIMMTDDQSQGTIGNTEVPRRDVFMSNGRIGYRSYPYSYQTGPVEFTGFKNLADGEWHRISIVSRVSTNDTLRGVSIYVDGVFEVRRTAALGWTGSPDYIGGGPVTSNSLHFVGDMSEVVVGPRSVAEDITLRYYDFMAWNPIQAGSMEAFAFTPAGAKGRGNQKRALYLYWNDRGDWYNIGGGVGSNKPSYDPLFQHDRSPGVFDLNGYKVFSYSVTKKAGSNQPYQDEVYDLPSLINLNYHVDMNDYDVIMFGDWPDEGFEEDYYKTQIPNYMADKERLLRQIRDANENGVGLMVTHPRLAVDLGIVDRVEWVPTMKESFGNVFSSPGNVGFQGNAVGLYDYGSAVKFPWDITVSAGIGDTAGGVGANGTGEPMTTDTEYLKFKAYFYDDQNFINKFRVRAKIEGLTDIPAYIVQDAVYHVDYDVWGDDIAALDLEDRMGGLQIGDEFIFEGTNMAGIEWSSQNYNGFRFGRPYGYYAVPAPNVKAGTVVTTFSATHWSAQQEVTNPFRNHATSIALDRGDVLAGRPVGGRIFVSFTEAPLDAHSQKWLPVDVLPGSKWDDGTAKWPNNYPHETAAQRNWEFSETRLSVATTPLSGNTRYVKVISPEGDIIEVPRGSDGAPQQLFSATYTEMFERVYVPQYSMTRRGIVWVGGGEKPQAGEKRVAATPMEATAQMPEPVVTAQKDGGYNAQPMAALAQMARVAESTVGDTEVHMLPMTAYAEFTGFSRVVSAAPMTATAELVESFDMVHATGEQVVLFLHGVDATLYLKEEA